MALHIPAVQGYIAGIVSDALADKLGTKVSIERVNIGLTNRIIIDGASIRDQRGNRMLDSKRLSANIDIIPLFNGEISISSIQIFGLDAHITKATADAPLNCQFVFDSLRSKEAKKKPLNLHISSLVLRNSNISYDQLDVPHHKGQFCVQHIALGKISGHVMLPEITDDRIMAKIKKLSFEEKESGLRLRNIAFDGRKIGNNISINDFTLGLNESDLTFDNAKIILEGNKPISISTSAIKGKISCDDIGFFMPEMKNTDITLKFTTTFQYANNVINLKRFDIKSADMSLSMNGHAAYNMKNGEADIKKLDMNVKPAFISAIASIIEKPEIQKYADTIGEVTYNGDIHYSKENIAAKGLIKTAIGEVKHDVSIAGNNITIDASTPLFHTGKIIEGSLLGDITANIKADINYDRISKQLNSVKANADIPLLTYNELTIHNIFLNINTIGQETNLELNVNDNAIACDADLSITSFKTLLAMANDVCGVNGRINMHHINPDALKLSTNWPSTEFSFVTDLNIDDIKHPTSGGEIHVGNFIMNSPEDNLHLEFIDLSTHKDAESGTIIMLKSNFCNADIKGQFELSTFGKSVVNLIASRMPYIPGLPLYENQHNSMVFDVNMNDATPLQKFLKMNIECVNPITLKGNIDDNSKQADITLDAPALAYNGVKYEDTNITMFTHGDSLFVKGNVSKPSESGSVLRLGIDGKGKDGSMMTIINFENGTDRQLAGEIHANLRVSQKSNGSSMLAAEITPSYIMTGDMLWRVKPATIQYSEKILEINDFAIGNQQQSIIINGKVTGNSDDSLKVTMENIDVAYVLDMVNFHSVDFGGYASGDAVISSLFSSEPGVRANLCVRDFTFSDGDMGTLEAVTSWNNELGQFDIEALCRDGETPTTYINGFISLKQEGLNLDIKALETPIYFMNGLCGSFLSNVHGKCRGYVNVGGLFKSPNLKGDVVADGGLALSALNARFNFKDLPIHMEHDVIAFNNDAVYDDEGHLALINGTVNHHNLSRWGYDININAKNVLCYDFPTMSGSATFCGKAYASGSCHIKGRPGETVFDIDATPEKGSFITYNVSSPDALQNQEFITWGTAQDAEDMEIKDKTSATRKDTDENDKGTNLRSDLRMNVLVHCTPDATLNLLMDPKTGDAISLNGSGVLRANYYNKGALQIFGNYLVDHGTYSMTIQQLLKKEFTFLPEGGITFSGPPFESAIDLHAKYTLNSVPLSDLKIGNSFSNNSVRVNCLMNINGVASDPKVDFALEFPQASTDVQQMITSLINSEEEMNQQVIYLLAIGRFYSNANAENTNGTSQTSLAMQSFLSGTVSQQINNAISSMLKSNSWNFGANVSPGDEGMQNAEYEGLLSGRLLNNRLLINGQFGYRDNQNATSSFIGDFDVRYLLLPSGNMSVRVYNQTSDRYFSRNTLNTQGLGVVLKHDFNSFGDLFRRKKTKKVVNE